MQPNELNPASPDAAFPSPAASPIHEPSPPTRAEATAPLTSEAALALEPYPTLDAKIRAAFGTPVFDVVFTDIDGTLHIGAGHSEAEVAENAAVTRALVERISGNNMALIPITGSHFEAGTPTTPSVHSRMNAGILPAVGASNGTFFCDALAAGGGTKAIGVDSSGAFKIDEHYAELVRAKRFDYEAVLAAVIAIRDELNGLEGSLADSFSRVDFTVVRTFDTKPVGDQLIDDRIYFQLAAGDDTHARVGKLALYFYANTLEERDRIEAMFIERFPNIPIVCCEEKDANAAARRTEGYASAMAEGSPFPLKYCLDLTPVDKGSPIELFTALISARIRELAPEYEARGLNAPNVRVWFCGDAGNDLNAARRDEVDRVVMVGGSSPELTRYADSLRAAGKEVYVEDKASGRIGPQSILAAMDSFSG